MNQFARDHRSARGDCYIFLSRVGNRVRFLVRARHRRAVRPDAIGLMRHCVYLFHSVTPMRRGDCCAYSMQRAPERSIDRRTADSNEGTRAAAIFSLMFARVITRGEYSASDEREDYCARYNDNFPNEAKELVETTCHSNINIGLVGK